MDNELPVRRENSDLHAMGTFLLGAGWEMSIRRAPLLGLVIGSTVMGAALLLESVAGLSEGLEPCAPSQETRTSAETAPADPLRLASVALPAPPPLASRSKPASMAKPSPRPARRIAEQETPIGVDPVAPLSSPATGVSGGRTALKPIKPPTTSPRPLIAAREREIEGRPLLRMLEHGEGPIVEIAWPKHRVARAKLYELLRRCHGLETVLLRDQEILMNTATDAQRVYDTDRHSGFLRAVIGASPRREREILARLRSRHGDAGTRPARLLSRAFDARLLGGLAGLAGPGYRKANKVTARYAIAGRRVMILAITVDGRDIAGRIEIDPAKRCAMS